jgi:hypothetical protein
MDSASTTMRFGSLMRRVTYGFDGRILKEAEGKW